MPLTLYRCASSVFASTSTFASAKPFSAVFSSSTGVSARQGPHQSAQKSTTTGSVFERSITSASNVSSVTSIAMTIPAGLTVGTRRRDLAGVEAEPMHASEVARVLDLEAAVHDDVESAPHCDLRAFRADHAVLEPERSRPDGDRLRGDARDRVRRAEHVDDVDVLGNLAERRVRAHAQDRLLPRVDGNHLEPVAAQVVADEVRGAQLVRRQANDRHG